MPAAQITVPAGLPRPAVRQALANVLATMQTVLDTPVDRLSVWVQEVDRELCSLPGPFVQVMVLEGRPQGVLQHLIRQVTDGVAHALETDRALVRVVVAIAPFDLWGIGGVPASVVRAEEMGARARTAG